jgi:hypothetical protein
MDSNQEPVHEKEEPKKKTKRQLTPQQLEHLAAAREKANRVRKEKAEVRKQENIKKQEVATLQKQAENTRLNNQLAELQKQSNTPGTRPKTRTKKKTKELEEKPKEESDSEEEHSERSSSSDSDSDYEYVPVQRVLKSKKQRRDIKRRESKRRVVQEKSTPIDKEQNWQPVSTPDLQAQRLQAAFSSLFPTF